mmetsp:Transcript_71542/g.197539  ORF Transcript_71542/g.197539 Transcript_71542/m.197539 type:complete len:228 (-) Transcript_71542:536-1219(-)
MGLCSSISNRIWAGEGAGLPANTLVMLAGRISPTRAFIVAAVPGAPARLRAQACGAWWPPRRALTPPRPASQAPRARARPRAAARARPPLRPWAARRTGGRRCRSRAGWPGCPPPGSRPRTGRRRSPRCTRCLCKGVCPRTRTRTRRWKACHGGVCNTPASRPSLWPHGKLDPPRHRQAGTTPLCRTGGTGSRPVQLWHRCHRDESKPHTGHYRTPGCTRCPCKVPR